MPAPMDITSCDYCKTRHIECRCPSCGAPRLEQNDEARYFIDPNMIDIKELTGRESIIHLKKGFYVNGMMGIRLIKT